MKRRIEPLALLVLALIFALAVSFLVFLLLSARAECAVVWDSYSDPERLAQCDLFVAKDCYVYMKATGLPSAPKVYQAKYCDANGQILLSYTGQSSGGVFLSQIRPSDFQNPPWTAKAGTWTAELYKTEPTVQLLVIDTFTVDQSAIPEFPTVAAGIGVVGLCLGSYYYWRRKWVRGPC